MVKKKPGPPCNRDIQRHIHSARNLFLSMTILLVNDTQDSCEAQHGGYERIPATISTVCAWRGSRTRGMRVRMMTVTGDSSWYSTFVSFPTIFALRHFICTGTKYFICNCWTGPKSNQSNKVSVQNIGADSLLLVTHSLPISART